MAKLSTWAKRNIDIGFGPKLSHSSRNPHGEVEPEKPISITIGQARLRGLGAFTNPDTPRDEKVALLKMIGVYATAILVIAIIAAIVSEVKPPNPSTQPSTVQQHTESTK